MKKAQNQFFKSLLLLISPFAFRTKLNHRHLSFWDDGRWENWEIMNYRCNMVVWVHFNNWRHERHFVDNGFSDWNLHGGADFWKEAFVVTDKVQVREVDVVFGEKVVKVLQLLAVQSLRAGPDGEGGEVEVLCGLLADEDCGVGGCEKGF